MSKGSQPRPAQVPDEQVRENWARTFRRGRDRIKSKFVEQRVFEREQLRPHAG